MARSGWWGVPPRVPPTMTGWGTPPPTMTGWCTPPPHQHSEHLLRDGRYASCVHAGRLSCVNDFYFHDERRTELELKIRRRVALEEKAHRIVERLLDNPVQPDFMIDCVSVQPT